MERDVQNSNKERPIYQFGLTKKDILILHNAGLSYRKIGNILNITHPTVHKIIKELEEIYGTDKPNKFENDRLIKMLEENNKQDILLLDSDDDFYSKQTMVSTDITKNRKTKNRKSVSNHIKKKVLDRDGYKCRKCGDSRNLEAHHIKLVMFGGTDDLDNLITLCKTCHKFSPDDPSKLKMYLEIPLPVPLANIIRGMDCLYENIKLNYLFNSFDYKKFREEAINQLRGIWLKV